LGNQVGFFLFCHDRLSQIAFEVLEQRSFTFVVEMLLREALEARWKRGKDDQWPIGE